jgi:hypothetical protein
MSTLSLRLPESIHRHLKTLAEREGISINQLINSAVAEKLAALMTEDYLEERASAGRAASCALFSPRSPMSPPPTRINFRPPLRVVGEGPANEVAASDSLVAAST